MVKEPLRDLIERHFPQYDDEGRVRRFSPAKFAVGLMDVSPQTVFTWFERDSLPTNRAKKLVELSNGSLTLEDLLPYLR